MFSKQQFLNFLMPNASTKFFWLKTQLQEIIFDAWYSILSIVFAMLYFKISYDKIYALIFHHSKDQLLNHPESKVITFLLFTEELRISDGFHRKK